MEKEKKSARNSSVSSRRQATKLADEEVTPQPHRHHQQHQQQQQQKQQQQQHHHHLRAENHVGEGKKCISTTTTTTTTMGKEKEAENLSNHQMDKGGDGDLAQQIKQKLSLTKSHLAINGCVVKRENGLAPIEHVDEEEHEDEDEDEVKVVVEALHQEVYVTKEQQEQPLQQNENNEEIIPSQEDSSPPEQDDCDSGIKCSSCQSSSTSSSDSTTSSAICLAAPGSVGDTIEYIGYVSETQMPDIMRLIQKDLSEPYSIYTYRYFIHNWPKLCFLAMDSDKCVGAVVCKLDLHKKLVRRGYIAMLAVDENYRKRKIGSNLVLKAIRAMVSDDADEVVLETEITNKPALRLYENLGFVRDKRLFRYYLNGVDALRLKLWLR